MVIRIMSLSNTHIKFSIMTFSITTFSSKTLSIMTFGIATFGINGDWNNVTLQHST